MDDDNEFSGLWYGFGLQDDPAESSTHEDPVEDPMEDPMEDFKEDPVEDPMDDLEGEYIINFGANKGLGYNVASDDYDYEATQRTSSAGNQLSEKEWMAMLRNPKENSLNQLQFRVFTEYPFDEVSDTDRILIYFALRRFPGLEMRNIPLLVAAYLFHKLGRALTKDRFNAFYQPFGDKPNFNRVDLVRYIRLVDRYIKK